MPPSTSKSLNAFWTAIDRMIAPIKSKHGRLVLNWLRRLLLIAILVFILRRIIKIGWAELFSALPSSPLFYLLSIAIFLVLPISETFSYRQILSRSVPKGLYIFSRKRVFNEALISYSGEAYLCQKLTEIPGIDRSDAVIAVKDNNLISALISNSWTIALVGGVLLFGRSDILEEIWKLSPLVIGFFAVICLILYGATLVFFKRLSSLSRSKIMQVAATHSGKVLVLAGVQLAQWASGVPAELLSTWLVFLTVQILLKRIPFLPNSDIVFLAVAVPLAGFTAESTSAVTAMLIAAVAMNQLVHLGAFILTSETFTRLMRSKKYVKT